MTGLKVHGATFLVTGAGSLGAKICEALLAAGARSVRLMDVRPLTDEDAPPGVEIIRADLRSRDDVFKAVQGVNGIFHTAAVLTGSVDQDVRLAIDVNL